MPDNNEEVLNESSTINIASLASPGFLPNGVYTVRITEIKQALSSKGNLMDTITAEIIAPNAVEFAGANYTAAGVKVMDYWSYTVKGVPQIISRLIKLGLNIQGSPSIKELRAASAALVGYSFEATVQSQEQFEQETLTPAQVAAGEKSKDLLFNNEKISRGWSQRLGSIVSKARASSSVV